MKAQTHNSELFGIHFSYLDAWLIVLLMAVTHPRRYFQAWSETTIYSAGYHA